MLTKEQFRIISAVLTTAIDEHRDNLHRLGWCTGHSAISEICHPEDAGDDVECLHCGHINEAEYMLSENYQIDY